MLRSLLRPLTDFLESLFLGDPISLAITYYAAQIGLFIVVMCVAFRGESHGGNDEIPAEEARRSRRDRARGRSLEP